MRPVVFREIAVGLLAAVFLLPLLLVYAATRHKPVADRAFLMLNCSGFNIGNFCFPVIQAFMGPSALVTASMFDIGNSVIVTAGSNVMTSVYSPVARRNATDSGTVDFSTSSSSWSANFFPARFGSG